MVRKYTKKKYKRKPGSRKMPVAGPGKKLGGKRKYSSEEIIAALHKHGGLVNIAARNIGCDANIIYERAKIDRKVKECIAAERATFVDEAEGKLREAVNNGESWAISFTLKTLGKERGYAEQKEYTHTHEAVMAGEVTHTHTHALGAVLPQEKKQGLLEKVRALRPSSPPTPVLADNTSLPQALVPVIATVVNGDEDADPAKEAGSPQQCDSQPDT